jgi:hypothetical protein
MAVETLIPVRDYLSTSYDPDMEYVDGALMERNVGDWFFGNRRLSQFLSGICRHTRR